MIAFIPGLISGLALIVAIGAQNAFVIRQGLTRKHVLFVIFICALSDAMLIAAGTAGLGQLIKSFPTLLEIIRWFGVLYLSWFGFKSLANALKSQSLTIADKAEVSKKNVLIAALGFTFLNPHVYLDTVILLGSLANQWASDKWFFATGAMVASIAWFSLIGFASRFASRFMTAAKFWKILDTVIALVMFTLALTLALYDF
jgi:L-lysine exporter family protein LysE/ArgO